VAAQPRPAMFAIILVQIYLYASLSAGILGKRNFITGVSFFEKRLIKPDFSATFIMPLHMPTMPTMEIHRETASPAEEIIPVFTSSIVPLKQETSIPDVIITAHIILIMIKCPLVKLSHLTICYEKI
jgi:hypothetical protein